MRTHVHAVVHIEFVSRTRGYEVVKDRIETSLRHPAGIFGISAADDNPNTLRFLRQVGFFADYAIPGNFWAAS